MPQETPKPSIESICIFLGINKHLIMLSDGSCQSRTTEYMLYESLCWRHRHEAGEMRFKFDSEGLRSSVLPTLSSIKYPFIFVTWWGVTAFPLLLHQIHQANENASRTLHGCSFLVNVA